MNAVGGGKPGVAVGEGVLWVRRSDDDDAVGVGDYGLGRQRSSSCFCGVGRQGSHGNGFAVGL
jgi:hypothetical protein